MEVAKTFDRNGIRYRPGDALPPDLDTTTLAHYRRHGMVREIHTPAPTVKKPAAPRKQAAPKPVEIATAVPVPEGVSPSAAASGLITARPRAEGFCMIYMRRTGRAAMAARSRAGARIRRPRWKMRVFLAFPIRRPILLSSICGR